MIGSAHNITNVVFTETASKAAASVVSQLYLPLWLAEMTAFINRLVLSALRILFTEKYSLKRNELGLYFLKCDATPLLCSIKAALHLCKLLFWHWKTIIPDHIIRCCCGSVLKKELFLRASIWDSIPFFKSNVIPLLIFSRRGCF